MGWWKIEGTSEVIGDGPLDFLGQAVREVIEAYDVELRRRPTKAEWEALLLAVLGADEPEAGVLDQGIVANVTVEAK